MELPIDEASRLVPPIFRNASPVAIVAGGSSLRNVDWNLFRGMNVIALNRAYQVIPDANVLFWSDFRFWRYYGGTTSFYGDPGVMLHSARWKITGNKLPQNVDGIIHMNFTGRDGFDPDPNHLRSGRNTGYAAIHLALHLEATSIVLFGYDMGLSEKGRTHWHNGYPVTAKEKQYAYWLKAFPDIAKVAADRGVEIVNACPDSKLTIWPRISIEEGFSCLLSAA